jgi:hypothetical protein
MRSSFVEINFRLDTGAPLHFNMTNNDDEQQQQQQQQLKIFDNTDDGIRLYIDETIGPVHCELSTSKSTNTGNPFELDCFLLTNINRHQTRSSQTVLTSTIVSLRKQHRSTSCQVTCFDTFTKETNTERNSADETVIDVVQRLTRAHTNLLQSTAIC